MGALMCPIPWGAGWPVPCPPLALPHSSAVPPHPHPIARCLLVTLYLAVSQQEYIFIPPLLHELCSHADLVRPSWPSEGLKKSPTCPLSPHQDHIPAPVPLCAQPRLLRGFAPLPPVALTTLAASPAATTISCSGGQPRFCSPPRSPSKRSSFLQAGPEHAEAESQAGPGQQLQRRRGHGGAGAARPTRLEPDPDPDPTTEDAPPRPAPHSCSSTSDGADRAQSGPGARGGAGGRSSQPGERWKGSVPAPVQSARLGWWPRR